MSLASQSAPPVASSQSLVVTFDNEYHFGWFQLLVFRLCNPKVWQNLVHGRKGYASHFSPTCRAQVVPASLISAKLDDYICGKFAQKYLIVGNELECVFSDFVPFGSSVSFRITKEQERLGVLFLTVEAYKDGRTIGRGLVQTYKLRLRVKTLEAVRAEALAA
jgi:hypothetical protein